MKAPGSLVFASTLRSKTRVFWHHRNGERYQVGIPMRTPCSADVEGAPVGELAAKRKCMDHHPVDRCVEPSQNPADPGLLTRESTFTSLMTRLAVSWSRTMSKPRHPSPADSLPE